MEVNVREEVIDSIVRMHDPQMLGYLTPDQMSEIHNGIRIGGISKKQVF